MSDRIDFGYTLVCCCLIALSHVSFGGDTTFDLQAGPRNVDDNAMLRDAEYATACGPIACFVAVKAVGEEATLQGMVKKCGWQPGQLTNFKRMFDVVSTAPGVKCMAVNTSPEKLALFLETKGNAAILAVDRGSGILDHAVCVVASTDSSVLAVEYPNLSHLISFEDLANVWDGEALLVSRRPPNTWIQQTSLMFLPGIGLGLILLGVVGTRKAS